MSGIPGRSPELAELLQQRLAGRSMSLTTLQRRLADRGFRVSLATLSYWRTGQRRPESADSLEILAEIEAILDLPPRTLLLARGPTRRPGPKPPELPVADVVPPAVPVQEALGTLGLADWGSHLVEEAVHLVSDVDSRGQATHVTCRTRVRAVAEGARQLPLYVFAGEPLPEPLVLESVVGATVTGALTDDAVGLALWRLELPRPLHMGETAIFETTIRLADLAEPDQELVYHAVRRLPELSMWVRFDPARLPAACHRLVQHAPDEPELTQVQVADLESAHFTLRSFGPGRAGFTFAWDG